MSGDKRSERLVKFWLMLAATCGAAAGALSASLWGLTYTFWGIAGVGAPIALALAFIERSGQRGRWPGGVYGPRLRRPETASIRRRDGYKGLPRRAKLHAISGRKHAEPPSSTGV